MIQRVVFNASDPEVIRDITDSLSMELPIAKERRKSIGGSFETRDLQLVSGEKIHANLDPYIVIPSSLL